MFENLMVGHLVETAGAFFANPANVAVSIALLALSLFAIVKAGDKTLPQKRRVLLIYAHLALLFAPFVLLALSLSCQSASLACAVTITQALLVALPVLLAATLVAGFLLLPKYYERAGVDAPKALSAFVARESARLGLPKNPRVFSFDSGMPFAFSLSFFKPRIFLSIGLQEVLSKKELEAVLLHELAHVKNASSWFKFSSSLLKAFSPLAAVRSFGFSADDEERSADAYAAKRQKTPRHLDSARRKVSGA